MSLPTDLTVDRVQESFASPDTLSVWALPGFISLLERSGFSAIRHRLHFQTPARPAAAGRHDGAGVRRVLDAADPARRRGADDRQRRRGRVHPVRDLQGHGGVRPVRRAARHAGRLGARRRRGCCWPSRCCCTSRTADDAVASWSWPRRGAGAAGRTRAVRARPSSAASARSATSSSDAAATATSRSPSPPTTSNTTARRHRHRHRPCRGVAERPRAAGRQGHLRPQHQRRRRQGNVVHRGAGRAGAVRRLRRADAGDARRRAEGHAHPAGGERQAGRQRRPPHGRQGQRADPRRLHDLQPVQDRPAASRRCGSCAPIPPCRTSRTSGSSTRTPIWTSSASRSPTCPISPTPTRRSGGRAASWCRPSGSSSHIGAFLGAVLLGDRRQAGRDAASGDHLRLGRAAERAVPPAVQQRQHRRRRRRYRPGQAATPTSSPRARSPTTTRSATGSTSTGPARPTTCATSRSRTTAAC